MRLLDNGRIGLVMKELIVLERFFSDLLEFVLVLSIGFGWGWVLVEFGLIMDWWGEYLLVEILWYLCGGWYGGGDFFIFEG